MRTWPIVLTAALTAGSVLPSPAAAQGDLPQAMSFAEDYRGFLDTVRTPMMVTDAVIEYADEQGFSVVDPTRPGELDADDVSPGSRLLFVNRRMSSYLVIVGRRPLEAGLRIVAAHADVPSLVLEPLPAVERDGVALLSARAYGGIKSYHYGNVPLEIRGVVVRRGGDSVDVWLGGKGHAFFAQPLDTRVRAGNDSERTRRYQLVAATIPAPGRSSRPAVTTVLTALHDKYGLTENDLKTARLYAVPTWQTRDVGLDRMALAGFGHDDRVCSFAALRALGDNPPGKIPQYTAMVVLIDREEIGSTGVTGMRSEYFRTVIGSLLEARADGRYDEQTLRRTMANTRILSSDVTAAVNPHFPEVHSPDNGAVFGRGPAMMKVTGSGGKYGASDANPEFVRDVVDTFVRAGVNLQAATLGRVDEGGGGTIAKYLAQQGAEILDVGVALLSMHSPYELVHKKDLYDLHLGFRAFLGFAP